MIDESALFSPPYDGPNHEMFPTRRLSAIEIAGIVAQLFSGGPETESVSSKSRSRMYVNSAREGYERALSRTAQEAANTEVRWVLNAEAEHCPDCEDFQKLGWVSAGSDPWNDEAPDAPFGGARPGSGDTQCLCITTPESPVLTLRGWVPLLDVAVGDFVLTHKGRWQPVTALIVKPAHPDHRQAWLIGPNGEQVGCTHNHLWRTEHGWRDAMQLHRSGAECLYVKGGQNETDVSAVRGQFGMDGQARPLQVVSFGLSLREAQGLPGSRVYLVRDEPQGQRTMGAACHAQANHGRDCSCQQEATGTPRGYGQPDVASQERWPAVELVLARRRESQAHDLPLSMGLDSGTWTDTAGDGCAPHQWQQFRRPPGESGITATDQALQVARCADAQTEQVPVVDLPAMRQAISSIPEMAYWRPQILFEGLLQSGTAVYDLVVANDHSFVIGGFVAHNTSCRCHLEYRTRGEA